MRERSPEAAAARTQVTRAPADVHEGDGGDKVRVGDEITMTPNGRDSTGCKRYTMSSRGFGPLTASFYRTHRGDFTTDRNEAACNG